MKHLRLTVFGLVLSIALSASSATYFCSPNGNGDGNSYATPCSLSMGINHISLAGDTLYLLGGVYYIGETSVNKSGNANKNIVISGYPGEQAILDFRQTPYGTRGLKIANSSRYLHIKNLTLRYSGKNNLYNEGSNCTFENLDIYGSADTGCQMKNGGNNIIKNVDSHHNFDYRNGTLQNADFGGNADGFADKQHSGGPNHYIGCRSWMNSDDGWDFYQRVTPSETIIENCICYQNGPAEYDMRNHARYQTDKAWFDQVNGATITNRYGEQQVVTLEHYPNHGNGNGFKLGGNYTDHKVLVHHCLSVDNTVRGFDQNNNAGTMRIYNNTAYKNGYDFGFTTACGTLSIQNCVSYQSRHSNATQSQTTLVDSHNTWSNGFSCSATDFVSVDTTVILSAREADGSFSQALNNLFALRQGSNLIDAGTNVGLAFMGDAPDLGWKETDGVLRPALTIISGVAEQTILAGDSILPVVVKWMGCDTKPTTRNIPGGITRKVSNNNFTLTFSGAITTPGNYTLTTTTVCDSNNVSLDIVIHVRPNNLRRVAFVTTPGAAEDAAILSWMAQSDSIVMVETDAADTEVDYSSYSAIVIGPKPSSGAAGFVGLKGYNKPMLVLKPFLFKSSVWNWGTPKNTQDLYITVQNPNHAIFEGLTYENGNQLKLFNLCNTNAVTSITDWTAIPLLASPVSNQTEANIVDAPAGTVLGTTSLPQRMVMIGVSEYSTANLTDTGLQLIENAIYYLLGLPVPTSIQSAIEAVEVEQKAEKIVYDGQVVIVRNGIRYSVMGQKIMK